MTDSRTPNLSPMANETEFLQRLQRDTADLVSSGLFKTERVITSPQGGTITVGDGREVVNLCANNYLGLSADPRLIETAQKALVEYGFGMSSVRFISGTQTVHKELEDNLSNFLGTEDTILYSSCFDANTGLFETLLSVEDAVISDSLNHASIIDGVRLCKAGRYRYANNDMGDLERCLQEAREARHRLIATDGVFSMDGTVAQLGEICDLAERYDALVMVDDSHAVGFMGETGRGTHEYRDVMGRVDILTGTLGKALGGASGGYTSGRRQIVDWLRQRSRPYLFSNTLAPVITATSIEVLRILGEDPQPRERLRANSAYFREEMEGLGFAMVAGEHPIIPVMLGDARLATIFADRLLDSGVYVVGFSFPVVPEGEARIRTQISAAHDRAQLDRALEAFAAVGRELQVIV